MRGGGGDADHGADQPQQQRDVLLGERVVDQAPHQEGLGQADRGAGHDQADHDGEPALEGREQAGDPAQGDGGVGELPLVGADGGVGAVAAATAASSW